MATQGVKRPRGANSVSPDKRETLTKSLPGENCPHCLKACSTENQAIQCDLCGIWAHAECEGIPSECYDSFNSVFGKVHNISYYCEANFCSSRIKQLIYKFYNDLEEHIDLPSLRSLQAEQGNLHRIISEMSNKFDDFSSQCTEPNVDESIASSDNAQKTTQTLWRSEHHNLCNSISALSDKIKGLCDHNDQLQNQINTTVSSLNTASEQVQTLPYVPSSNPAEFVDEYLNRERRKMNLVIHGLPESSATSSSERQLADSNSFVGLVDSEFKISNLEIGKCFRLGKRKNDKPRPLLVMLTDISVKRQILRNAKLLRNSNSYKSVFISPDLTQQEREVSKKLHNELKRRKQAGETNLIIKHGKIVPRQSQSAAAPAMDTTNTSN